MSDTHDHSPYHDDQVDGCEVDMADPRYTTDSEEEIQALLMFADLPMVGEHEGADGRMYPTLEPAALAQRISDLHALTAADPYTPEGDWQGPPDGTAY